MHDILVIGPHGCDTEELQRSKFRERCRFRFLSDPALAVQASPSLLDVLIGEKDLERLLKKRIAAMEPSRFDAVLGTDEYLACVGAAILSEQWGLPGSPPRAVLSCQHKYYSRLSQREVVPEAVPRFVLIDPFRLHREDVDLEFPMFVKPVRGSFSICAKRMESFADLKRFVDVPMAHRVFARKLMEPFNRLLARYTSFEHDANFLIGEEILQGRLVTVEAMVAGGEAQLLGITDSEMYSGTMSFRRFDYPSSLPPDVQRRMQDLLHRLAPALGLDWTLFNVEMFWDESTDRIAILEINPRMAFQFADLYEKVEGFNSYDVQIALALGERGELSRGSGPHRAACSFVMRRFEDARLVRFPTKEQVSRVHARFPDARIHFYGNEGHRLSEEIGVESWRYCLLNLGGSSRADLDARYLEASKMLEFVFEP